MHKKYGTFELFSKENVNFLCLSYFINIKCLMSVNKLVVSLEIEEGKQNRQYITGPH